MPIPLDVDATWLNSTAAYDAGELRRADAALVAGAGGVAFGGIARHSDTTLAVSVDGSDVVTVQPGSVVIPGDAVTGTGIYRASISSAQSGSLTARNATNPRIDLLVFRAMDTDVVGSHASYRGRLELIAGTPAATPAVPTRPSMAVELARITVPQSGGGAATVDSTYRTYACAAGGELLVPTSARFPTGAATGQRGRALDNLSTEWIYNGTAWTPTMQLLSAAPMTDGNGYAAIVFPTPFATQISGASIVDRSNPADLGALFIKVHPTLTDRTQLVYGVFQGGDGSPLTGTNVSVWATVWGR